jgi:predicted transcriptional regulator
MNNTKDYCPKCQQITNQKCLFTIQERSEHDADFHWEQNYETIQCLGCENIQFRNRYSHEDMFVYSQDGYEESFDEFKYYPKNLANHTLLKNRYHLPEKLKIVYIETLEALINDCYLLAGVGLRAIIEAICLDQNIAGRTLEVKINNLVKNKLITEKDGNRLHSIRFLGNDSVHEMDVPKVEKLRIALDIAEHLLKNLYLIDIDVNQHLDTIISEYEDFKNLILRKFKAVSIIQGQEMNIKDILKKDFRRVEASYLTNFTTKLVAEIQNNLITAISIGKLDNNQQFFIKN